MIEGPVWTSSVWILGQLPPAEVDRCARAADVFINLRHPEDEASSMSLMYQLPFGRPVITYDSGSFAEVPDETVAKVAVGDRAGLRESLRELVEQRRTPQRDRARAAKRVRGGSRARDYARQLLRFAMQDAAPRRRRAAGRTRILATFAERIAVDIGASLASLGAPPGSAGRG